MAAKFFGVEKKEKILFSQRKTWKSLGFWTQEDYVKKFFKTDFLDDIYAIKETKEFGERAEKEAGKLNPELRICYINGNICYQHKDELRLYDFLVDLEKQSGEDSAKILDNPKVERKSALDATIGFVTTQRQSVEPSLPLKKREFDHKEAPQRKENLEVLPIKKDGEKRPMDTAPTEEENERAENWLTEELKKIDAEAKALDAFLSSTQESALNETSEKKAKKSKSKGRTNQIMTRLTDKELIKFQRRVEKSGLAQGEFIRRAVLTSKIIIEERSMADVGVLDDLAMMQAELGRQGGLLKMIIKPNLGQRELTPDEWAELMTAVRDMEKMKKQVANLEEKVKNGHRDSQHK